MQQQRFIGKTAIVTGAASGIGEAVARAFAAEGAVVLLLDCNEAALQQVSASIPGACHEVVDIARREQVRQAFDAFLRRVDGLDYLVNGAGVMGRWTLQNMAEEEWDRVLDINLKGTMLCTQAAIEPMKRRGGGAIVNVASMAGKRVSYAGAANYTASKAGVLGFTQHAAFELGAFGIRVNAVCPGPTLTGMSKGSSVEQRALTASRIPLGRWVMPEDVAHAVLFLSSEQASMCTGTSLDVDGGILVSNGSSYDEYFSKRM